MASTASALTVYRFADFEFSAATNRLLKHGTRLPLERKPALVLCCLLENAGRVVTRAELQRALWPENTFVDFELGLRVAVNKLRLALSDSPEHPRYIETVIGEGYRFIGEVTVVEPAYSGTTPVITPIAEIITPVPRITHRSRWFLAAAITLSVVFLAWRLLPHPAPAFHDSGWVLITNFENRTGQPLLDGSLEYALTRELSNSQFVKVVPRERVEDVLRLTKKPLTSKIDVALGREICLRDGEIKMLISGRVEKTGTSYVLSAELVNAADGTIAASFSEEDRQDSQLAAAVRRLSSSVRQALGENPLLIEQSNEKLEKVTTPSLHALQLYSEADKDLANGRQTQGEALLREAVRIDPDFASAYILLAWAVRNQSRPIAEWKPLAQHAFQLSDSVPDRERYFIRGSYYQLVRDFKNAAANYEVLSKLYPDHFWATNNLAQLINDLFRVEGLACRASDLRPKNRSAAIQAWSFAFAAGDSAEMDKYYRRAMELVQPGSLEGQDAVVLLDPVLRRVVVNDTSQARAELNRVEEKFNSMRGDQRPLATSIGGVHAYFGELRSAEKWFALGYSRQTAHVAYELNRAHIRRMEKVPTDPVLVARFASDGDPSAIARALATHTADGQLGCPSCDDDFFGPLFRAELEASNGDRAKGIAGLREGFASSLFSGEAICAANLLAHHLEAEGDLQGAATALESLNAERDWPTRGAAVWVADTRFHLAQLYRKLGRKADAEKVEAALRQQLIFADPDHPIVRKLSAISN